MKKLGNNLIVFGMVLLFGITIVTNGWGLIVAIPITVTMIGAGMLILRKAKTKNPEQFVKTPEMEIADNRIKKGFFIVVGIFFLTMLFLAVGSQMLGEPML
jgi:hypothetical protein